MARLIGPDESVRVVYLTSGTNAGKALAQGLTATVYADEDLTTLADIRTEAGAAVTGSALTVDAWSKIPLFQFPDGVDTVWTTVNGGPAVPLYAREDDRLDALGARISTLESTPAPVTSVAGKTGAVTLVAADVTGVETSAGAQDKADAAQAFAIQRANHTGTQSADTLTDGTTNKAFLATERTKLAGIATGATANATDAQLRDRSTHTGTQSADTLTDGTTNKAFLATERTKLAGIAAGATANATDAQLRDRSTHTGTQSADTLTDGTTNKAFLATERTKLSGIATGATANQADLTTQAKSANFTAAAQFFYVVDSTSGAVTATLPAANVAGQVVAFKWDAGPNTVTIQRAGSDTIGSATTSAAFGLPNEAWVFESSGAGQWNLIAGNKALSTLDDRYGANWLTTGQEAFNRELVLSNVATASGQLRLSYFTCRKAFSSTQVRMWSGSTAAGATPTLCRIGLWLAAADGSCSAMVASIANDTTLFAATNTAYTRSWSTPYTTIIGQRYAVGALVVTGAAAPNFGGTTGAIFAGESASSPALNAVVTGLSDLPSTVAAGSAGTGAGRPYAVVLP